MNDLTEAPAVEEKAPRAGKKPMFLFRTGWKVFALTGLGLCLGLLSLFLSATAYEKLSWTHMCRSYLMHPLILVLNLLPGVLFIWLFYFLFRRPWAAFLGAALPVMGVAFANYFKIRLRSDPLLAVDLTLVSEAGGIVGQYKLDFTGVIWLAIFCLILGTVFARFFIPNGKKGWKKRLMGVLACLVIGGAAMPLVYLNPKVYAKTDNPQFINIWSDTEVFVSKGMLYPFLYSFRDIFPTPPEGYNEGQAAGLLNSYKDADIPEDKKVNLMGIMLEAFCDLTDFPMMADQEAVAQVYQPWHDFEQETVHGNLVTNIFAGGTVDSEWAFLTGYSQHDDFRSVTDSYVWYLKNQGYQTFGVHPGNDWFYNRVNVNQYLGFDEYWFLENHYSDRLDMVSAIANSDGLIARDLVTELGRQAGEGPTLSFSVSIQNHGPYSDQPTTGSVYVTPEATGMSEASCNIWNNYLKGIDNTIGVMLNMKDELESMEEPVVLVLFGDHKPWGGNANSAYAEMGADFSFTSTDSFYQYYTTPYIIWANSAAKELLGNDFTGEGGDFSPCFLMPKVFDLCGWEGPGFMQLSREMRAVTPVMHEHGFYLQNGEITDTLSDSGDADFARQFLGAQFFRETQVEPPRPQTGEK